MSHQLTQNHESIGGTGFPACAKNTFRAADSTDVFRRGEPCVRPAAFRANTRFAPTCQQPLLWFPNLSPPRSEKVVILNGAQLRCESRFSAPGNANLGGIIEKPGPCRQKPDSSVAPLPQNDKGGDCRRGLSLGTQFSGSRVRSTHHCGSLGPPVLVPKLLPSSGSQAPAWEPNCQGKLQLPLNQE